MSTATSNRVLLKKLLVVVIGMFGFGFALVPFYKKICEVTGVNKLGEAERVTNTQVDASRWVTVQLDANVQGNLPWRFKPLEKSLRIHPGQIVQAEYEVRNLSDRPVTGQAIPSYGPRLASLYFKKLECFCFSQQALGPGEARRMPVVFVVDSKLPKDVDTITLSYTFFAVEGGGGSAKREG